MTFSQRRKFSIALAASLVGAGISPPLLAQDGPAAKIIVGFPAGGSFDAIARMLAEKLKTELKRPVFVDNKPGAGGRIAVDALKTAPADGSVMMLGPDALTLFYPSTFKKLSYDPKKDLTPVSTVAEFPFGFAVGTAPKAKSWEDYVQWAKTHPQEANYGVPALGAPHHFYGILLGQAIGVPMQHVPFQGSAPILLALMGGQISSSIDVATSLVEGHRSGKIKILAVTSPERIPQAPDVPTFAELGYKNVSGMGFNALYAPPNTTPQVVSTWHQALSKVLAMADIQEKLSIMGFSPVGKGPQELLERQNAGATLWTPIIKASGFTAD